MDANCGVVVPTLPREDSRDIRVTVKRRGDRLLQEPCQLRGQDGIVALQYGYLVACGAAPAVGCELAARTVACGTSSASPAGIFGSGICRLVVVVSGNYVVAVAGAVFLFPLWSFVTMLIMLSVYIKLNK